MLGLLAGAGVAAIATACGSSSEDGASASTSTGAAPGTDPSTTTLSTSPATALDTTPDTTQSTSAPTTGAADTVAVDNADCSVIPTETGGPFPGDGSNGPNVRPLSGVVRQDIRSSIDGSTGTADGLVLEIELTINDSAAGCEPRAGSAVYLWHCDQGGKYSMYDIPEQNYLRGIAEADANGIVKFTTIVPGCYAGRWPHMHFEVFESLADAVGSAQPWATSQLAFPADVLAEAYTASGYESSVQNLGGVSLSGDNVFGDDGGVHQLANMSGNQSEGYTATLTVNA